MYDDSYFLDGGAGYPNYFEEHDLLREHGRRYAQTIAHFGIKGGILLEIGAAAGFVLQGFQDENWVCKGIEPNKFMASFAARKLGIDVECSTLEDYKDDRRYDLVTMIQVLPHLVGPLSGLQRAVDLVRPGGYLLIETWNRESWTAKAFGRMWHEYSPPSVLHWFTPTSVAELLSEFQFEQIATGRPIKYISGAHVKSLLTHKMEQHRPLKPFSFMTWLIPKGAVMRYRPGDLFWSLFRNSKSQQVSN